MKTQIRLALMVLASASASAFAQGTSPQCAATNEAGRNVFTVVNPAQGAINQQCFLTVMPKPLSANDIAPSRYSASQIQEGNYEIELSGGGGGGGGGSLLNSGGGGSGAVPVKVTRYLSPGVYRLTIGTGGEAGGGTMANGDAMRGSDGNPTSMSNAYTQETVAGFPGAETWAGRRSGYMVASARGNTPGGMSGNADFGGNGEGAKGMGAQSDGGSGGKRDEKGHLIQGAQDGGMLKVAGYTDPGGKAGANGGGGGGGAGYGKGMDGVPARGGATPGTRGGDGFIALRALDPVAQAPVVVPTQIVTPVQAPAPVVLPKKDRG